MGVLDNGDIFGQSVANMGDLDGDMVNDLAVGANMDDDGGTDRGAVWILFMNADGTVKDEQKISDIAGGFMGVLDDSDLFGTSVANMGDLDGDMVNDLAVGAPNDDDGDTNRGAVWILFLNANGTVKGHQKISDTAGGFTGMLDNDDLFGSSVANMGDLDGNGVDDLAVGAIFDDDGGGVEIIKEARSGYCSSMPTAQWTLSRRYPTPRAGLRACWITETTSAFQSPIWETLTATASMTSPWGRLGMMTGAPI